MRNPEKLSDIFYKLSQKQKNGKSSIGELVEEFDSNSIVIFIILFAAPGLLPLPYLFFFSFIIAVPLIILSIQLIMGSSEIKLPKKIKNYRVKNSLIIKISLKAIPILKFLEKFIKPRFSFFYSKRLVGFFCLICAVVIAIPLPFTTAIPAMAIIIMMLGLLNNDLLVILCGAFIAVISVTLISYIIFFIVLGLLSINYYFF